jgi:exonuclease III
MDQLPRQYRMFSWNVHGLSSMAKQQDVTQVISSINPDLVCLQETKLSSLNPLLVRSILGAGFKDNYVSLPASGARGRPHCGQIFSYAVD